MKKRIIAVLLAITMLVSVFNIGTMVVFGATPDTDVTITVLDSKGDVITDANPTVRVTCTYRRNNSNRTRNITVKSFDPGVFGYNYYESNNIVVQYYTVNVTLTVDNLTYTASEQVVKDADSVVIRSKTIPKRINGRPSIYTISQTVISLKVSTARVIRRITVLQATILLFLP